jgi:hypothetical protein
VTTPARTTWRRRLRPPFIGVALLLICGCAHVSSHKDAQRDLVIARDGRSDYVIVIPPSPLPQEEFAAREVARYLKQMSGAELPIRQAYKPPDKAIWIHRWPSPYTQGWNDFVIGRRGNTIVIDEDDPALIVSASYHLLDSLGCRFLAPNLYSYENAAEVVSACPTVDAPKATYGVFRPTLRYRKLYVEEGRSHDLASLKAIVDWMPKVGYNTLVIPTDYQGSHRVMWEYWRKDLTPELQKRGVTIEVGGHGYQNFLNADMEDGKLFDQHPDWFGQDATGVRHREKNWALCTSNPAAVEYLTKNFVAYIKARPEIQIYDFWPPDGAKWCECDACKKLGTPSDRQAILLSQLKAATKAARPDLRLEMIAYASYLAPPEHAKVDKAVLVDFCPINQQFDSQIDDPKSVKNADYATNFLAWKKSFAGEISIYSYYRKYAWRSLPVIIPHYMQKDLKWYARAGAAGVSTYCEPGDWFTYELNHYVLAQLAWDPNCDVDAIVKKFCAARYGDFADQAQSVLLTLEDVTRKTCSLPNVPLQSAAAIEADIGRMTKMIDAMTTDAAKATDPVIKRNLQRLGLMCEYARKDLEIQRLRATSNDAEAIRTKTVGLQKFLADHADEGVLLVRNPRSH